MQQQLIWKKNLLSLVRYAGLREDDTESLLDFVDEDAAAFALTCAAWLRER